MSIIALDNISKSFGPTRAVQDASFDIEQGEIVGFVGPNGAGKSTTINLLMGFMRPERGSIQLLGQSVRTSSAHITHNKIGYASGDMALFGNLRGQQYLEFMTHLNKVRPTMRAALVEALKPVLDKPIRQLSRGNKQKIALIGALQHQPELIILDEPTSGLDPLMQDVFLKLVEAARQKGATVFMSSHILSEVAHACDRVLFMKQGKIIVDKPVDELEKQQGKIVTIYAATETLQLIGKQLPKDAIEMQLLEHLVRFRYTGEIKPLLGWIAKLKGITDVTLTKQDLDDIFHDLYQNEEPRP